MTPEDLRRAEQIRVQLNSEPAFRLEHQMRFVNRMSEMSARNSAELRLAVRAIGDPRLRSPFRSHVEDPNDDELLEVARRLDNFLASAISRVERCLKSAAYVADLDPALRAELRKRLDAMRSERPLYRLGEYLRNHSTHVSYHGVQAEVTFQPLPEQTQSTNAQGIQGALTARVFVVRPAMTGRSRQDVELAAIINAFPPQLEIEAFARGLSDAADQVVTWYFERLRSIHTGHRPSLDALRAELKSADR